MRTRHWDTWLISCFLGLLPLIARIISNGLVGQLRIIEPDATRELLFFALSTSITAMLNLSEDAKPGRSQLWMFGALTLTVFSALSYGEFLVGEALHAAMRSEFAYHFSFGVAIAAVGYSALIEGLTHPRYSQ